MLMAFQVRHPYEDRNSHEENSSVRLPKARYWDVRIVVLEKNQDETA